MIDYIDIPIVTDDAGASVDILAPQGIPFLSRIIVDVTNQEDSQTLHAKITSIFQNNSTPTSIDNDLHVNVKGGGGGLSENHGGLSMDILTDSNSLIRHRVNYGAPTTRMSIFLKGRYDKRGNI